MTQREIAKMSKVIRKESPLHYVATVYGIKTSRVEVKETPFLGYINLRGDYSDSNFRDKVEKLLGMPLPKLNIVAQKGDLKIYCTSPDEWMIITKEDQELELEKNLRIALEGEHFAVINVTGGFTTVKIDGKSSRELISKGTSFDIHPQSFKSGQSAQTHFAHAVILLELIEKNEFNLVIRRSFAEYLWDYLKDASKSI